MSIICYEENKITFYYDKNSLSSGVMIDYPLGEEIMNFLHMPLDKLFNLYNDFFYHIIDKDYFELCNLHLSKEEYDLVNLWANEDDDIIDVSDNNIYLSEIYELSVYNYFYLKLLKDLFYANHIKDKEKNNINVFITSLTELNVTSHYEDIVILEKYYLSDNPSEFKQFIQTAINLVMIDIELKRKRIEKEVKLLSEEILATSNTFKCFQYTVRLLPMDNMSHVPLFNPYNDPIDCSFYHPGISVKEIKNKNLRYVYSYDIVSLDALISFEIIKMTENDTIIKRCNYCNYFFIVYGRSDTLYCNRKESEFSAPCNKIGAKRSYDQKVKNDDIRLAYKKAYNKMISRYRRNKIDETTLQYWKEKSRVLREECLNEKLSYDDFVSFLNIEPTVITMNITPVNKERVIQDFEKLRNNKTKKK